MIKNIVLLGSTGSIGQSALAVLRENQERFRLIGLAAGGNTRLLEKQIREFDPPAVSVKSQKYARELKDAFPQMQIFSGAEGLHEIVSLPQVDCVIAAINGTDGLPATIQALRLKRRLCLANKEAMVAAGDLINLEAAAAGAEIIPIDSEQSAIFQCLAASPRQHVRRVILTASGGPFFQDKQRDFSSIRVEEALTHPNWSMGKKITIDSATLMNKALEIIEAHYLFHLSHEQIEVLIHPQSVVHSLVEFIDSSLLAQLGIPDMKLPILYSLSHPERIASPFPSLDLSKVRQLEFFPADRQRFASLQMAYDVLRQGLNAGAVFNAANEVAVEYFLARKITFKAIFAVVGHMLDKADFQPLPNLFAVQETISLTRSKTIEHIEKEVMK